MLEFLSSPIAQAFIAIMTMAAVLAIFLSHHAVKKEEAEKMINVNLRTSTGPDFAVTLSKLSLSPQHKAALVHSFNEELEKKVVEKSIEIEKKFAHTIEDKEKKIELVEKQFKMANEQYNVLDKNFKNLGREKKQTEEIVRSMAEGVIMVNEKGETIFMNPAAEKLLNVSKEERIGKNILSDLKDEQMVTWAQEISGKEEKEIVLQSKSDQTQKILRASNAIIESEDGKTVGFVSVLSDVTKQRELDQLKEQFVANISHDLRTPLNNVNESLSLLQGNLVGKLTPEQERIVTIGVNNAKRLNRLINDLLDLSKMEAKKFSLIKSVFQLDQLILNIAEEFQPWSRTKNISIETKLSGTLEIEGDQDRISQVLTNLVGNALKFTPSQGIVEIQATRKNHSQECIEVAVRDTGPGISKKDHARIFEKFVQLDSSNLQGVSGTGLGLAIAKEIVELHGGRIWLESQEGRGSRFAFELPLKTGAH